VTEAGREDTQAGPGGGPAGALASLRDRTFEVSRLSPWRPAFRARAATGAEGHPPRTLHVSRVAYILIVVLALALPGLAHASASEVIRDCADDGDLDGSYSNGELNQAQRQLPSDLDEYSDCREVIAGAVTSGSDKGGGRDSRPPRGAAAARAERAARERDRQALPEASKSKPRVEIGGTTVEPGSNGLFDLASAANGMPLPLVLALILAGLLAVAGALHALRRRIPLLARLPLPSIDLSRVPFPRRR
jgi:hypothetical protein